MIGTYKNYGLFTIIVCAFFIAPGCKKTDSGIAPVVPPPVNTAGTFTNPLQSGSDPWVIQKDSFYYYTQTSGNKVMLWKTKAMSKLSSATFATVFSAMPNTANSSNVWAPELHLIDGKWYVYYAAGSGPDSTQRLWVLENTSADPLTGTWIDKGQVVTTGANFWAIDGTVLSYNGNNYLIWSGRPNVLQQNQNIYIAKIANPWTLESAAVMISKPDIAWELYGGPVNEGPEILQNAAGKTFLVYSASGCWTDEYALGMLTLAEGSDPLVAANWTKATQPVFVKQPQNNAYGPGHNAFFKSKNGAEDWIIYHANSSSGQGCGTMRNIRMQKFTWNPDGTPSFGEPVKTSVAIPVPAGE